MLTRDEHHTRQEEENLCDDQVSIGAAKHSVLLQYHVLLDVFRLLDRISTRARMSGRDLFTLNHWLLPSSP